MDNQLSVGDEVNTSYAHALGGKMYGNFVAALCAHAFR